MVVVVVVGSQACHRHIAQQEGQHKPQVELKVQAAAVEMNISSAPSTKEAKRLWAIQRGLLEEEVDIMAALQASTQAVMA